MKTLEELRNDFILCCKTTTREEDRLNFITEDAFKCFIDTVHKTLSICITLESDIQITGLALLTHEILVFEKVLCDELDYDKFYEPHEDDIEFAYENMCDEILNMAFKDGYVCNIDEKFNTTEELYFLPNAGIDGGGLTLDRYDTLEYIRDYYIDEITEQANVNYEENNKLAHTLISQLKLERKKIAKLADYEDYKLKFINLVKEVHGGSNFNTLNIEVSPTTYDFGIFFHFNDMSFLKSVLYPMLSEKKGKSVAVTLKALEQLNIINIDKISRAKLYEVLRKEMNINATDAGINSCLKNEKRGDEIKREVEILKGLLNI